MSFLEYAVKVNISHIQYKKEFDLIFIFRSIPKPSKQHFKMLHNSLILMSVLIKFIIYIVGHTLWHISLILLCLCISLQFGGITLNFLP